jgi:hypothetical protein
MRSGRRAGAELRKQRLDVAANSRVLDAEITRDGAVTEPGRHARQHLKLTRGEMFRDAGRVDRQRCARGESAAGAGFRVQDDRTASTACRGYRNHHGPASQRLSLELDVACRASQHRTDRTQDQG